MPNKKPEFRFGKFKKEKDEILITKQLIVYINWTDSRGKDFFFQFYRFDDVFVCVITEIFYWKEKKINII